MTDQYLMDACALIAYINDEDGADVVDDILTRTYSGNATVSMSMVNLLEVYYGVLRDFGKDKAEEVLNETLSLPISIVSDLSIDALKEAGRLKASYKMSIADSIALSIASVSGYIIVTADHHEMDSIEQGEPIKFHWIR